MNARAIPACTCLLLGLANLPAFSGEPDPVAAFTQMRMEFAKVQKLEVTSSDTRTAIRALAAKGKLDEAAKQAQAWLAEHPVDAEAHLIYGAILRGKGDFQGYFKHRFISQGLVASVAASGSGRSEEAAMKVVNIDEEFCVIRALGGKLKSQALTKGKSGRQCDRMECEIDGQEITLYFDVTLWMQTINKAVTAKLAEDDAGDQKESPSKVPKAAPEKVPEGGKE